MLINSVGTPQQTRADILLAVQPTPTPQSTDLGVESVRPVSTF